MSGSAGHGTDWPRRIATVALLLLALIAAVSLLSACSTQQSVPAGTSATSTATAGADASAHHSTRASGGRLQQNGLATVRLTALPAQARDTVELIEAGGPFPYSRDGVVFGNYEHRLPSHPRGWYHEYTVPTPGVSSRGVRRIITGKDSTLYYTGDHYRTFAKVLR